MPTEQYDLSRLRIPRSEERVPPSGEKPRRRPGLGLIIGTGAALLLLSLAFFLRNSLGAEEIVDVVTASMVSPEEASSLLTASGYVVAQRKAAVASKATGRIVYLGFSEGDRVRRGDIIARIESADVEAALAQAKADLAAARADRDDARSSLDRAEKLLAGRLISQSEYDAAKSRFDRVVALIDSRAAAVRSAEVQVENTRIRAPFDGTILTKNADVGEVVAPFAAGASSRVAVVTMADMGSLKVEADVSESNIERIALGQACQITLNAYPESGYPGVVDKIVPTADRAKATVLTKVRFARIDGRVLPEMEAKVRFLGKVMDTRGAVLAVDPAAVVVRDGKKIAFIVRGDEVREGGVVTGDPVGRLVEVKSGLSPGDRVVIHPSSGLHSGARVKLKQ